jgi:hypothetical protein
MTDALTENGRGRAPLMAGFMRYSYQPDQECREKQEGIDPRQTSIK